MPVTGEIISSFVRSAAAVIYLSFDLFGCGYDVKVLSSHLFIANNNDKCFECKMFSSATLHVSTAFPFLNKSRRDMMVKNGDIDGNDKEKCSCGDWCQEYLIGYKS
ncbi:hypothetical protein Bca52824_018114 [Brassica carinata]|uniref:Uncharacterized protein n=1 Tax=Brassica carinata TaxID=52824 RepID=A0A8X8AY44_BRACI|nr:hypothetical protein Bca52824_018114 [Brassica carinata]